MDLSLDRPESFLFVRRTAADTFGPTVPAARFRSRPRSETS